MTNNQKTQEQVLKDQPKLKEIQKKFDIFCAENSCAIFATFATNYLANGEPAIVAELRIQLISDEMKKELRQEQVDELN